MAHPHVVNAQDIPWTETTRGSRVAIRRKQLGTLEAYLPLSAQVGYWEGEVD